MNDTVLRDRFRKRRGKQMRKNGRIAGQATAAALQAALAARAGRAQLQHFAEPVRALGPWSSGGYPARFLDLAFQTLGVTDPSRVLHLCAGGSGQG